MFGNRKFFSLLFLTFYPKQGGKAANTQMVTESVRNRERFTDEKGQ